MAKFNVFYAKKGFVALVTIISYGTAIPFLHFPNKKGIDPLLNNIKKLQDWYQSITSERHTKKDNAKILPGFDKVRIKCTAEHS